MRDVIVFDGAQRACGFAAVQAAFTGGCLRIHVSAQVKFAATPRADYATLMPLGNTSTAYGIVTRILHWVVALLIIGLIGLGWWMVGLSYYDRWYYDARELHKALGMLALTLGGVKVLWYLSNHTVAFATSVTPYQRLAARSVHVLFLALMVVIPVTGYVISTSAGEGVSMFGLFEVPALLECGKSLRELAIDVHFYASYTASTLR